MTTDPPRRARSTRGAWAAALGIAVSMLFLYWSLRGVDLGAVWRYSRTARPVPLLAAVILATLPFPLRLVRWRLLLRQEDGSPLPLLPAWHAIAMGFMANNLFPFRAGELLRSFALYRLTNVRFTASIASVAVERVFDGLTVVALLFVGLITADLPAGVTIGGTPVADLASRAGMISIAGLIVALLVVAFPVPTERLIRRVVPAPRVADRLVSMIEGIRLGFVALRSPTRIFGAAFWSLAVWLVIALSFWAAFFAFNIPVGLPGAMLLMGILVLVITIPSTPGYIGVFEGAIVLGLGLFGIERDQAFAYAAVYHVTTFLPITAFGLWSMARTQIGLKDVQGTNG